MGKRDTLSFEMTLDPTTGYYTGSYVQGLNSFKVSGADPEEVLAKMLKRAKEKAPDTHGGFRELMYRMCTSWLTIIARENGVPLPDLGGG